MAESRARDGRVILDYLVPEIRICVKNDRYGSQLEKVPIGQTWDNLSIKISNDINL